MRKEDCPTQDCELRENRPCYYWGYNEDPQQCVNGFVVSATYLMRMGASLDFAAEITGWKDRETLKKHYVRDVKRK